MSRYIDADKLPINILDLTYYDGSRVRVVTAEDIDNAPSIDIVPKCGEWQYICKGKWMFRRCSCCEWTQTYDDSKYMGYRYNFCPNCGARMKGADDER